MTLAATAPGVAAPPATSAAAPASRARRLVAVALFLGVPIGLFAAAGLAVLDAEETAARTARQAATVAQLQRRLAAATGGEARRIDTAAIYLAAPTQELAAAALQQLVVRLTDASGARLIETQPVDRLVDLRAAEAAVPTDGEAVSLRLSLDAGNAVLLDLLTAIEGGLPLLTVERIQIRRLAAGADDDADPRLRVDLVVGARWKAVAP